MRKSSVYMLMQISNCQLRAARLCCLSFCVGMSYSIRTCMSLVMTSCSVCKTQCLKSSSSPPPTKLSLPPNQIGRGNHEGNKDEKWKVLEPETLSSRSTSLGSFVPSGSIQRLRSPREAPGGEQGYSKRNWEGTLARVTSRQLCVWRSPEPLRAQVTPGLLRAYLVSQLFSVIQETSFKSWRTVYSLSCSVSPGCLPELVTSANKCFHQSLLHSVTPNNVIFISKPVSSKAHTLPRPI